MRAGGLEKLAESVTTSHADPGAGGGVRRAGPSDPAGVGLGGSKQASAGPVHGPEAGSCLRRADGNKAWEGPRGPGSRPSG